MVVIVVVVVVIVVVLVAWPPPPPHPKKKRGNGVQKYRKKPYKVHLEVTRLERHANFRRSISLDDVDCFDTWNRRLNSGTNSSHCSNKGFKILLEFFCCALRAKVVFFVRRHRRK